MNYLDKVLLLSCGYEESLDVKCDEEGVPFIEDSQVVPDPIQLLAQA